MAITIFNDEVPQGEYWAIGALVSEDSEGGPIFDFTGWEGEFVVRKNVVDKQALLRSPVVFVSGDAEKNILVQMLASETSALSSSHRRESFVYEVKVWETGNKDATADRVIEGTLTIVPSTSREDSA